MSFARFDSPLFSSFRGAPFTSFALALLISFFSLGCGNGNSSGITVAPPPLVDLNPTCGNTLGNETCKVFIFPFGSLQKREYILTIPETVTEASPPVLIFLHGGGGDASSSRLFFGTRQFLETYGYIGVFPNARINSRGFRSWDFDDVEFIDEVINQVIASENVDPSRVFVFGYSNGGFLANYLACKIPSRVTAIMSHAGNLLAPLADPINDCATDGNVAIHHIHATGDDIIPYDGVVDSFLSADEAILEWSRFNQCDTSFITSPPFDLALDVPGNETVTRRWQNCIDLVEQTVIEGSSHLPSFDLGKLKQMMQDFYLSASQP